MRVLVVHPGPHFSVADVYNGLVKGLKANGCEVATLNLDDRIEFYTQAKIERDGEHIQAMSQDAAFTMAAKGIEVACYEYWPDVVIVVSGWFVPPAVWGVLARRPHHVVYWCTESPYEDDRQARPARYVDTVILNDPVNLEWFRSEVNPNTYYLPHSYDPDVHYPGQSDVELEADFGFVGTGFPSRLDFLEEVDWGGAKVLLGGNWKYMLPDSPLRPFLIHDVDQCMRNDMTAHLYRSVKVSANLYRKEHSDGEGASHDGWAMGPREVELAACETFFLREPRGEGDELFPMLPTFTEPAEFSHLLRWWLDHPIEREAAAKAARAAIADRTFQNTTARLLEFVKHDQRTVAPSGV